MKHFFLDEEYITSISVHDVVYIHQRDDETPEDFLIRKLSTDNVAYSSYKSIDHPKFTELREQLGKDGYIEIQRGWWNGDRVLKPFKLNGRLFKKGDQYSCAAAQSVYNNLNKKNAKKV